MKLLIVRHAIAEDRQTFSGDDDDERALTDEGRRKFCKGAKGLANLLKAEPDLVVASPLVRSQQTAEILLKEWRSAELVIERLLRPDAGPASLIKWLMAQTHELVVLVGHEPQLSRLASSLLGAKEGIELKKGGACLLELGKGVRAGHARLQWLLTPGALRALA